MQNSSQGKKAYHHPSCTQMSIPEFALLVLDGSKCNSRVRKGQSRKVPFSCST